MYRKDTGGQYLYQRRWIPDFILQKPLLLPIEVIIQWMEIQFPKSSPTNDISLQGISINKNNANKKNK